MGMHTTKVAVGEGKFALEAQLTVTPRGMAVYLLAGVCAPGRHGAGHSAPRARPYGDGEHPGRSVPSRRDPGARYRGGAGHAL